MNINQVFTQLTAISRIDRFRWVFRCDCGREIVEYAKRVEHGWKKSCGCRKGKGMRTHGCNGSPEWAVWAAMKQRCLNPNNVHYKDYGGRGIYIHPPWLRFENFLADMGKRPAAHMTLERIDNNGPYAPWNCAWLPWQVQANNTRANVVLEMNGVRLTVSQWGARLGIKPNTISCRLRNGWTVARALTTGPFQCNADGEVGPDLAHMKGI